jgi:hypothetical protein
MDWFLAARDRCRLASQDEGGARRTAVPAILDLFNVGKINETSRRKRPTSRPWRLCAETEDQAKARGFVLESQLVVNNKKTETQGTLVVSSLLPAATTDGYGFDGSRRRCWAKEHCGLLGSQAGKVPGYQCWGQVFRDKDLTGKMTLKRDAVVDVTALELKKPAGPKDKSIQPYIVNVITDAGIVGWMRLANLARQ